MSGDLSVRTSPDGGQNFGTRFLPGLRSDVDSGGVTVSGRSLTRPVGTPPVEVSGLGYGCNEGVSR